MYRPENLAYYNGKLFNIDDNNCYIKTYRPNIKSIKIKRTFPRYHTKILLMYGTFLDRLLEK